MWHDQTGFTVRCEVDSYLIDPNVTIPKKDFSPNLGLNTNNANTNRNINTSRFKSTY
jgi:hypothetical protein